MLHALQCEEKEEEDVNVNITSFSSELRENLTDEIFIPRSLSSSSEEEREEQEEGGGGEQEEKHEDNGYEEILSKVHPEEMLSTDAPYLPLIPRCSTSSDCSADKLCNDGKCLVSRNRFDYLSAIFIRCQDQIDCPSGSRCIFKQCIPFRW
uniref:Uncharacterized protein n=1 Tax=Caenorhabditis japonica TaxID=281687 RepID=A0A8R1I5A1_CAEJA